MRLLIFLGCIFATPCVQAQLVPYGSNWNYYDLGMAPPNQSGVTWKQNAYDTTGWASGPAELGYGDGDEATPISSSTLTGYFRHTFVVNDPGDYDSIQLFLTYDDGAVIYLNGIEIWRVNMPAGTITYNTFASSNSGDNAQAAITLANTLITGTNLLAVEVHQRSASSSDLSFDFNLTGVPAAGIAFIVRGPYLQKANDTSLVVRWRTNIPTPTMLDFGLSMATLTQSVIDTVMKMEHILPIDSLTASTMYFYQIRTTDDTLLFPATDLYFKTYPTPGVETPLTAWILGDCGTGNNNARNVRDAYYNYIDSQHTDMILFLGDNAYDDGTDPEYQTAIFQNMYEEKLKNTIAWSCLGNHDGHSANSATQTGPYYDIFTFPTNGECGGEPSGTEAFYSFDFGNIHFIVLDSYDSPRSVGGPMYIWCEDDLMSTLAKWIVVFWHHPAYSKGSHNSDTETALKQMRENFLPLLEDYGVDLVLSGHSHSYERSFLLNEHYGLSGTFNTATHTVGVTGSGSGKIEVDDAYYKAPTGPQSGIGAVYITTGSSGKISAAPLNHPAMYYDTATLGSCVLQTNQDTLSIKFLRQTGAVDDHFTLIKDSDCVPGASCNDGNPCTLDDVYDNYCYCRGLHRRYVSHANDNGPGSLRDAIASACPGDSIFFQSSVTDTIRLDSSISFSTDVVVLGDTLQNIVISGQQMTRIFHIEPGVEVTLSNITLYAGNEPVNGGAFLNEGQLMLENTTFIGNMQGATPRAWTNHAQIFIQEGINFILIE